MLHVHDFALFLTASLLIMITPGPDMLYLLGRTASGGKMAGIASALGIAAGNLIHITAAALGISALLLTSAWLFTIVKIVGACYLTYLGLQMLLSTKSTLHAQLPKPAFSLRHVFIQAMLTDILNPKVALFFLAFLPQFIDARASDRVHSLLCLGLIFIFIGAVSDLFYVVCSSWFARSLKRSPNIRRWLDRVFGCVLVGLGIRLALDRR